MSQLLNGTIVATYKTGKTIEFVEEIKTEDNVKSPLQLIREHIINEIIQVRNLRKELKKQYPELLVYAK